jgi:hypothetical protein
MSKWVYLPSDIVVTTAQEDTPVSIRIQVSSATVKALHNRLQQAYLKDDVRLVRRTTVLLDLLVHLVPSTTVVDRMLSWFHTPCGGWNHGVTTGAVHGASRPGAGDGA